MGKGYFLILRFFVFSACLLAFAGCNNEAADRLQSGQVMGFFGLEGRWVGPVTPQAEGCVAFPKGQMTVGSGQFAFDPFQGTTVIDGTVAGDHLQGTLTRVRNGQPPLSISFSGVATQPSGGPETIEGTLTSGRCSWAVKLMRG